MVAITVPQAATRRFDGVPASIREVRTWVKALLPASCARVDDVELVVSELATNAVLHSVSGAPGGTFAVQVEVDTHAHSVGVTCVDMGPAMCEASRPDGEGGHGLPLVRHLADRYQVHEETSGRTVRCWLDWAAEPNAPAGGGRP
ncbi:ATP-binding protein [Nonomuraea sp. NPDC004702]